MEQQLIENNFEILNKYIEGKRKLDDCINQIANGIIIRTKINCYEYGEKNTSYFLRLEQNLKAKTSIRKLFNEDGVEGSKIHNEYN